MGVDVRAIIAPCDGISSLRPLACSAVVASLPGRTKLPAAMRVLAMLKTEDGARFRYGSRKSHREGGGGRLRMRKWPIWAAPGGITTVAPSCQIACRGRLKTLEMPRRR